MEVASEFELKDEAAEVDCEEVMMTESISITNGEACVNDAELVEYLEENDPINEQEAETEEVGGGEEGEEEEPTSKRTRSSQVPKKRKDTTTAREENKGKVKNKASSANTNDQLKEVKEEPVSSARATTSKGSEVDDEQCRVCTSKEDLVSLFKQVEKLTIAEMLMTICPTVSIAPKDFLPQYICNPCLDNVTIAVQLKTQCETTERELRKKLSRSKNKMRRPLGYVVIDAPAESDPQSEEEPIDDVEFKVSDEAGSGSVEEDDDSEDSDFGSKKKRPVRKAASKRRKSTVTPTQKAKEKQRARHTRPLTKRTKAQTINANAAAANVDSDDDGGSAGAGAGNNSSDEVVAEKKTNTSKKKRTDKNAAPKQTEYPCDECDVVCTRKLSLVLHKKTHSGGREPISCEVCGRQFKIQGAYRTHLEKHKDDANNYTCDKCEKTFTAKSDLRKHRIEDHGEQEVLHQCEKCKRTFITEARMARHLDGRCPGHEMKQRRNDYECFNMGKDLFKSVAPLTTTYWSDSFSE